MTESSPMTREELLELAALDALGLLSEYESALYTRSFHYAAATVQNEILALQAMIAADETLLPNEEPAADLRERVLARVAAVIERESPAQQPLAKIGRRRGAVTAPAGEPADRHRAAGVHAMVARQFWRTATFVLCGTIVVVAWFAAEQNRSYHQLTMRVFSDLTSAQVERLLGPTFKEYLFDDTLTFVRLNPEDANNDAMHALVALVEGSRRVILAVEGLQLEEGYELRLVDANKTVQHVATFDVAQQFEGIAIDLPSALVVGPDSKWEIRFKGEVLLASA